MKNILIIGFGGFLGSILRYVLSGLFQKMSNGSGFPYGTLGVNLLGCLLIGLLGGYADNVGAFTSETRLFLFIGILGAFTTFSTFGYETMGLIRNREIIITLANIGFHIFLGLFFVWIGYRLTHA